MLFMFRTQLTGMDTDKGIDPVEKALQEIATIIHPDLSEAEVITQYDNWSSYDEV